jgi:hypothetical protein
MSTNYSIQIEQGATFALNITWKDSSGTPVDITGFTARMQVRRSVSAATVEVELNTENGRIDLGGAAGTIGLSIPADVTAALSGWRNAVYDLELVSTTGVVKRLLSGAVELIPEVTR